MIIHQDTLLSEDLFEKKFICDLNACKGACCIEGDGGAPLNADELPIIEAELNHIKPFLSTPSNAWLETNGAFVKDNDGDWVTQCLPDGKCVFAVENNGILGCGIEKAWKAGSTTFQKPVSCHLYPIRITRVGQYDALNYHSWSICKPACQLGEKHQMPVYKFLKDSLVRKYGQDWYAELEEIAEAYLAN